ncbi:Na(+)/citrate cotransporter-like isoform X1 [Dreissena polymorpha]|nr:Na(+)/citrate cotransporter-like isoform X1 [Dreissena polymorpha]
MGVKRFFSHLWALKSIWITVIAFGWPLFFAIDYPPECEKQSKCAYVIIVMAVLWLTEAIPIPVTALLPIFMFPMTGVLSASITSASYVTDTTMLFLGGLIIAVALEETGLHTRISLCVMMLVGAQPIMLMLGLMTTTAFLSMWISNTAAASMMIPIIMAVSKTVKDVRIKSARAAASSNGQANEAFQMAGTDSDKDVVKDTSHQNHTVSTEEPSSEETSGDECLSKVEKVELDRLSKGLALSVAYGANIGGIATLTGTPPNLVLKQIADSFYNEYGQGESPLSFAKWMGFAFPMALICLVLAWLWLSLVFLRLSCFRKMDPEAKVAISGVIRDQLKKLGWISLAELQMLIIFILLVVLWLFREPPNIKGWGIIFPTDKKGKSYLSDSTPCILLSVLLFLLPSERPNVFGWFKGGTPGYKPLLKWSVAVEKLPWGVIVLLGGGFAMANASQVSGLSEWLGHKLKSLGGQETWVMNLIISLIVATATEVSSNTATAQLLLPILLNLSLTIGENPLYLMISCAVACSYAFMLPVATPPNAIVFSTGFLSIPDMALVGIPMNIIGIACLTLAINTWGKEMFDLGELQPFLRNVTAKNDSLVGLCI